MNSESTAGLLTRLFGDFAALVRNEIQLAKAEIAESTGRARAGIATLIAAVSTLLAGALVLVSAIILGLAKVMEAWLAALIVGLVVSAIGIALLLGAKKRLMPPHLEIERTRAAVRQDVNVLARKT